MPQPVTAFLRHSQALKTAMAQCLDDPTAKAVHWLRSSTRRLEATLLLLVATADLPTLPKRSKKFSQSLRRVRRAASKVRDLDAHNELLTDYKATTGTEDLTKHLEARRSAKVQKLRQKIREDQHAIDSNLDKLEITLASASSLNLSGEILVHLATSSLVPTLRGLNPNDDDDLHAIRKACKTARYIAEIGSESSKAAVGLEKRLHNLLKIIGAWHDHLVLRDEAQESLPSDSPLTETLRAKAASLRSLAESTATRLLTTNASKRSHHTPDVH